MIRWFTDHPTAANLLLLLFLAAGAVAAPTLKRETFPDFRPVEAEITVVHRGASPDEVEDAVCRRVWDAVEAVEGLDELVCTARQGLARAVATMQPGSDPGRFVNDLRTEVILMPQGTPLHRTEAVAAQVTAALGVVDGALSPGQPGGAALVRSVQTRFNRNDSAGKTGPHVATVSADLLGAETRRVTLDEITRGWREAIGPVPGAIALTLTEPGFGPQGIAVEIRLMGPELDARLAAGDRLLAELETYRGAYNVTHDLRPGRPEFRLSLAEGATGLGLTAEDVADQVGAAFLGRIVDTVQTGDISHEIELEQRPSDRDTRDDLRDFTVTLPNGPAVPLSTVARIREDRGWSAITHVDGQRTLTVEAKVDARHANAEAIVAELASDVLPRLVAGTPGLSFEIAGQSSNSAETSASILRGFLIGLVGVYAVLSFQFRSYVEPIIAMLSIPLAMIGVVLGHLARGYDISMPSLVGAASLAGIVVNNAILLVQVIKRHAAGGLAIPAAASRASRERFRPILVSVSTTIMGLLPLLLETSTQAQTLKPLVISVVFALLSATVLVLVVLPALYAILDDLVGLVGECENPR